MQEDNELTKKKADSKLKLLKDFSFLLDLQPILINEKCTKYVLEEGQGQPLFKQPHQFDIIHSCKTYTYDGRALRIYEGGKVSKAHNKDTGNETDILAMLLSMKVNEKAWFNLSEKPINWPAWKGEIVQDDDGDIQDTEKIDELDYRDRKGTHYEIKVWRLEYKNEDSIDGKRLVIQQKREEAIEHFKKKEYSEAIKLYKFIYGITSNCSKKLFTEDQLLELEGLSSNAKINFLKCYFKLVENGFEVDYQEHNQLAEFAVKTLIAEQPNNSVVRFLHAKWLLKERKLSDSFEEAKRSFNLATSQSEKETAYKLLQLIQEEIKNKGKIKMRVDS